MALSGTITASVTGRKYIIEWSATQSVANNTSTITCVHKLQNSSGFDLYISSRTNSCTVDGTSKNYTSSSISTAGGSTITLGTTSHTVTHGSDGTKKLTITGVFNIKATLSGGYVAKMTASADITLDTIPRASTITSANNITLGENFNIKWTPASNSFKYRITLSLGSWSLVLPSSTTFISPGTTSAYTYNTYDSDLCFDSICAQLPTASSGTVKATLTTYNSSGSQIGSSNSKTFTVTIPSSIMPSLGTITVDTANITTTDGTSQDVLIKGKNRVNVSVSGSKAGTGSSIKSYTYSVLAGSTVIASEGPTTSTSVALGPFQQTEDLKFRVTVTDNRDRSVSNSGKESSIRCYDYISPYFSSFNAYRANSDGTANVNGTYLQCDYTSVYSEDTPANKATITVHYNEKTSSSARINLGEKDTTYTVYLTIEDNYGGSSTSSTITVFGQSRIFNITKDGTGFAIGKMAEIPDGYLGIFESRWPAKFDDDCKILGDCEVDGELTVSGGLKLGTSTIDSQDTILTDQNIGNYAVANGTCLPLSGGTLTGKLTLDDNLYYANNNTAGLDCQNSDIINANGIYFRDASDSAGESINFYRSDGLWDTLYAVSGALKFHPNRGTTNALGGYTIYNSSNFRRGTCTLNTDTATTVNFTSAFSGTPTVILTPLTETGGVIAGKVRSVSSSSFTAIIGGSDVSANVQFAYLAIYY